MTDLDVEPVSRCLRDTSFSIEIASRISDLFIDIRQIFRIEIDLKKLGRSLENVDITGFTLAINPRSMPQFLQNELNQIQPFHVFLGNAMGSVHPALCAVMQSTLKIGFQYSLR
ncbi:MAG: hypothetical protein BWY82_01004 [Verrucomicrobia bacterium ADurb.Bin474]|nr:MAG: hypothetical protein BWY82_01004 [Verrucomicrobia bacterium ADurb.Bin474]